MQNYKILRKVNSLFLHWRKEFKENLLDYNERFFLLIKLIEGFKLCGFYITMSKMSFQNHNITIVFVFHKLNQNTT
jgi:hypothetical protein